MKKKPKKKYVVVGVLASFLIFVVTVAVVLFFFMTRELFSNNSHFILKNINVEAVGWWKGKSSKVASVLELQIDETNLFNIQLSSLKARLESEPSIEKVQLYRLLPDTLNIKITERIPRASLNSNKSRWVVDSNGIVMSRKSCLNISKNLPVIMGFDNKEIIAGATISVITPAVELVMESNTYFPKLLISRISLVKNEELIFTMYYSKKNNFRYVVYMPRTNIKKMLGILQKAVESAIKNRDPRKYIKLSYNGIIVMGPK